MKRLMMSSLIGMSFLLSSCVHGGKNINLNGCKIKTYEGFNYSIADFNSDGVDDALIKENGERSEVLAVSKQFIYNNDLPEGFVFNKNTLELGQDTFNYIPKLINMLPSARPNLDELFYEISSR